MKQIAIIDGVTTGSVFASDIDGNFSELLRVVEIVSGATIIATQADWTQASTGATDYIKHKPATFPPSIHYHSGTYEPVIAAGNTGQYWRGDKTWQTLTIPSQVQTDWNAVAGLGVILNKPSTFTPAAHTHTGTYEPVIATGATNKYWRGDKTWQVFPTIPAAQVQSDWNAVAGLGVILNKPIISGSSAQVQSDWTQASTGSSAFIKNKPSTFTPTAHIHVESDITNLVSDLAGKSGTGHTHATYATTIALGNHTGDSTIHFKQSGITITQSQVTGLVTTLAGKSGTGHTHSTLYEPKLANPSGSSMVLTSTIGGTKSWLSLATKANIVNNSFTGIYVLTQVEYDAIPVKDSMVLYFIK